jgi:HAE1 family hydrophobic/amphiphilic exporter-1
MIQPGMIVRARSSSSSFAQRMGDSSGDRLSVEIRGFDIARRRPMCARRVKDIVDTVPGITDSQVSRREGMPEMVIQVDRAKAASLGINAADVANTLETVIGGRRASQFRQEGEEFNILVRLSEEQRANIGQLKDVTVPDSDRAERSNR